MRLSNSHRVGFFTIATNHYEVMLRSQLSGISQDIRKFNWHYVVATDRVSKLAEFLKSEGLQNHVTLVSCPAYKFPFASMLRFAYMTHTMKDFDFICYVDADMVIESAQSLHSAIIGSSSVHLVEHPGWTRRFGLKVGVKEKLSEIHLRLTMGSLGTWEVRRKSAARVARRDRISYYAGGLFFGPSDAILELSKFCADWMDADSKSGTIAKFHDESYLNRWAVSGDFVALGPEYCYSDFPWLPEMEVVVRAVDKSKLSFDSSHF